MKKWFVISTFLLIVSAGLAGSLFALGKWTGIIVLIMNIPLLYSMYMNAKE